MKTRFAEARYEVKKAEVSADYLQSRLGVPSDTASAVAYLASETSSWVTGHDLTVDGGLTVADSTAERPRPRRTVMTSTHLPEEGSAARGPGSGPHSACTRRRERQAIRDTS